MSNHFGAEGSGSILGPPPVAALEGGGVQPFVEIVTNGGSHWFNLQTKDSTPHMGSTPNERFNPTGVQTLERVGVLGVCQSETSYSDLGWWV